MGYTTALTWLTVARSPSQKTPDSQPWRPTGMTASLVSSQAASGTPQRSIGGNGTIA